MLRLVLALVSFFILSISVAVADVTGKPRVIDGDTIEIAGERIRLHGIDAPESKQTCADKTGREWGCGRMATQALKDAINDQEVVCKGDKRDRYKRLLAVCYVGKINLNAKMVGNGWALAYRKYSKDYVRAETFAKSRREGLWRGTFEPPWE